MSSSGYARPGSNGRRNKAGRFLGPIIVFFRGFLEHPRMVGSVIPSSHITIEAMLERVDWQNCRLFVEYGPGVGTFCPHILDRLPADGKLLAIDTNPRFIDYLRSTIDDERFHAVLGSAADVQEHVERLGFDRADCVLSGLPISTLPDGEAEKIVAATHEVLREGGSFLTYQLRPAARTLTRQNFAHVETDFVLRNIPPYLLTWGWKKAKPAVAG
ncbi:methyltransferase domain-containing protein [Aurantiacibacter sp. MUD11]|uniref:class I SAM-dependent methyltransferase n=1 Tax=Aurantiacibacter sp. MUD11 TaxID=3003265 RepID=UPI0022AB2026|nr:methyltransferase domain-containing protein [Aurantiacibacter sp. MUD11]WAT18552.1 methyltransferase domain-containing protein [Aurantiacibacter sp. MUD11]